MAEDIPDKVTAIAYTVPLLWGGRVIGKASISVDKVSNQVVKQRYVASSIDSVSLDIRVSDNEFEKLLGSKLLRGISITPEGVDGNAG